MVLAIEPGFGYWDTTHYPYGGCFRRASENTPLIVEITDTFTHKGNQESRVKLADGSTAVVRSSAIISVGRIESESEQARRLR